MEKEGSRPSPEASPEALLRRVTLDLTGLANSPRSRASRAIVRTMLWAMSSHGETDEFCYNIARGPVHVLDLNATLLHLMGVDHTKLTFRFQGRDYRLTDVHGQVVKWIVSWSQFDETFGAFLTTRDGILPSN